MTFRIDEATKSLVKVRILLSGVSGSGKSYGGLQLAHGLKEKDQKVVVIDTEHGSANDYADLFDPPYMVIPFDPPYTPERYIEAMEYAVSSVKDIGVLIVDSLTHGWVYTNDTKDAYVNDHPGCNSFAAWQPFSRRWNALIHSLLHQPCHVIATARSKTDWVIDGKKPVKVGTKSNIRGETDYEFNIEMAFNHKTNTFDVVKNRYSIDWASAGNLLNIEHGKLLYDYLHENTDGKRSRRYYTDLISSATTKEQRKTMWAEYVKEFSIEVTKPSMLDDEEFEKFALYVGVKCQDTNASGV